MQISIKIILLILSLYLLFPLLIASCCIINPGGRDAIINLHLLNSNSYTEPLIGHDTSIGSSSSFYLPITSGIPGSTIPLYINIPGPSSVTIEVINSSNETIYTTQQANPSNVAYFIPSNYSTGEYSIYYNSTLSIPFFVIPTINVSPSTTYPTSTVIINGSGFNSNSNITISFDGVNITNITTNGQGIFTYNYVIPLIINSINTYIITAQDPLANPSYNTGYTNLILLPQFNITPINGPRGTQVIFNGNYFVSSIYNISFNGTIIDTINIGNNNSFSDIVYTIPTDIPTNVNQFLIISNSETITSVSFNVTEPILNLSSNSGIPGSLVPINGENFLPNSNIVITFNGSEIYNLTANSQGSFIYNYTLPSNILPGNYVISAIDSSNNTGNIIFTVLEPLTFNPNIGPIGAFINIAGYGLAINSDITISLIFLNTTYPTTTIPSNITTNNLGLFSGQVQISNSLPSYTGELTIQAEDAFGNTIENIYTIINSTMVINPNNGTIGTIVQISGNGFIPNSNITITFDNQNIN